MTDLQDNLSLARLSSASRPRIHAPPRRWAGVGGSRHEPFGGGIAYLGLYLVAIFMKEATAVHVFGA